MFGLKIEQEPDENLSFPLGSQRVICQTQAMKQILLIFTVVALMGCASTSKIEVVPNSSETKTTPNAEAKKPERSTDVTNSRWELDYISPSGEKRKYDIVFRVDGKLEDQHPNNLTPKNDFWERQGEIIILRKNDGYSIYEGRLIDENTMSGIAKNKKALTWQWRATRK